MGMEYDRITDRDFGIAEFLSTSNNALWVNLQQVTIRVTVKKKKKYGMNILTTWHNVWHNVCRSKIKEIQVRDERRSIIFQVLRHVDIANVNNTITA